MEAQFNFYFSSKELAETAADVLKNEGYDVVTDMQWLAHATRSVTPEELREVEDRMENLAISLNGEYLGSQGSAILSEDEGHNPKEPEFEGQHLH